MTSLQDGGRIGSQRFGVSRSGAMDLPAFARANALVGNRPSEGALELMLLGGVFEVTDGPARLAIAGAPAPLLVDGVAVPPASSVTVEAGQVVEAGVAQAGVFFYLAAAGGVAVPADLGSVSLQPRAGIGGLGGRALRAGDRLALADGARPRGPDLRLPEAPLDPKAPIRVVLGPQDDHFDQDAIEAFLSATYTVSPEADRMGFRLAGPAIRHVAGFNIVSDGIVAGSVQVPGSGIPIVMMADHQTTGGYPKIATVVSADLGILAQRRAGQEVRFAAVGIEEAQRIARERAAEIGRLPTLLRPAGGGLPAVEELLALNLAGAAASAFGPEP